MENKTRIKAIQRIYKDLKEIDESPIEGLSIIMPDENNPFELRANILILDGIYKDCLLHMIMNIPDSYPLKAPKMVIAAGQSFSHEFHHHVFGDISRGYTICIDLLDHGFFQTGTQTGWTPAYTLSTILMQMQIFFSKDYDLPQTPSKKRIEEMKSQLMKFETKIKITNGEIKTHTYTNPFPLIRSLKSIQKQKICSDELIIKKKAYERLTCYLTRNTPDETVFPLGYPIQLSRDIYERINATPLLEILSYEGYMTQLASSPNKVFFSKSFDYYQLRTAMGANYNYWFPLYISEKLYSNNKDHIFNGISIIKNGIEGIKKYDFQPEMIISVFPCLMNKMIVKLQEGTMHQSYASIEAYCHFLRLFLRLLEEFPHLQESIDKKVETVIKNNEARNKKNLGDMGEFLILLAVSKFSFQNQEIWKELIKEYISRQFLWVILKVEKNERFFEEDREEIKKNTILFFHQITSFEMDEFYRASKISNNLLLFNCCAAKKFLCDKKSFVSKIDSNYGVVEEKDAMDFLKEVKKIKETINSYKDLLKFIGLGEIYPDYFSLLNLFRISLRNSFIQGYNSFKLSMKSNNFLYKIDYILLIIEMFLDASETNKKFLEFLTNFENHSILEKGMISGEYIFNEQNCIPKEFHAIISSENFLKNILSWKFFYFWLFLCSSKFENIPKKLILENFILHPKNEIQNPEEELEISCFSNSNIILILKTFSIVFNKTLIKLSKKLKVLTIQTICFYVRILINFMNSYQEMRSYIEKIIMNAFDESNEINYPFLNDLLIYIYVLGKESFKNKIFAIFKKSFIKHLVFQIKKEKLKNFEKKKKQNIMQILVYLYQTQFNFKPDSDFMLLIYTNNILKYIFGDVFSFSKNMDSNYMILSGQNITDILNSHKIIVSNAQKIEDLFLSIDPCFNYNEFLFSCLKESLSFIDFSNLKEETLKSLLENPNNCIFLAKFYWKGDFKSISNFNEKLEWILFDSLINCLIILFKTILSKKVLDYNKLMLSIAEIIEIINENCNKYEEKIMQQIDNFISESSVEYCEEKDFYRFLIHSAALKKKKLMQESFKMNFLQKYLRFKISKIWEEKFILNDLKQLSDCKIFFDFKWLKQTCSENDYIYKPKNKLIIFLCDLIDLEKKYVLEEMEKFLKKENILSWTNNLFEKIMDEKDMKKVREKIDQMIQEIQYSILEKFSIFIE